jgi:hypothetical protein
VQNAKNLNFIVPDTIGHDARGLGDNQLSRVVNAPRAPDRGNLRKKLLHRFDNEKNLAHRGRRAIVLYVSGY